MIFCRVHLYNTKIKKKHKGAEFMSLSPEEIQFLDEVFTESFFEDFETWCAHMDEECPCVA